MCEPVTMAAAASSISASVAATAAAATAATTAVASSTAFKVGSLAISAASAASQMAASNERSGNQNAAVAQNNQSALDAYYVKTKQMNLRGLQQRGEASMQKQDADLKALKAQGTAIAAAAGAGVQGRNVDELVNDFERSEGVLASRIDQKLEDNIAQSEMTKLAFQSEANSRIRSMQPVGMAEQMFGLIEPIAGFGLDYMDSKSRLADVEV